MPLLRIQAEANKEMINPRQMITQLEKNFVPQLLEKYPDLKISFGGQQKEGKQSIATLSTSLCYVLLAIFVLLVFTFSSYLQPILIAITIPFGFIGGILGHWIMNYQLSDVSFFGMLPLAGIIVNDSLVFVEQINVEISNGLPVTDRSEERRGWKECATGCRSR